MWRILRPRGILIRGTSDYGRWLWWVIEAACLRRFGTLGPSVSTPVLRSDNGLIFQSRRFRTACRDCRLHQEFIRPYTPEQTGMIERFFRSFKEKCVWHHQFHNFGQARTAISTWIQWCDKARPHQALR
ncbi:integrase core domain-containing protein [Nitrospiraceae bacterium AH_259_D15_M11_P09]|nr:integrase core domain-containing protein [Nitrospiraceae bacterium AH_259_D15_M11_P09]